MKCSLDISNFLEEISSLSHSIVFLYSFFILFFFFNWRIIALQNFFFVFCFHISLHCSFKNNLLAILWNSAFIWLYLSLSPLPFIFLFPSAICKASSDNHFAFLNWFTSLPLVQCYKPQSIVLQASCLPRVSPWIYLSPTLYNHKEFDLCHIWMT